VASKDGHRDRERFAFYQSLIGSYGARNEDGTPIPDSGLLGFAGRETELSMRQEDGATLRKHLESHERQSGERHPLLEPVECDDSVKYLWEYFCSMNTRRTNSGFGYNPITDEGVEAWARRRGYRLERFENVALDALEQLFLSIQSKAKK
jgi:hypothetical protein